MDVESRYIYGIRHPDPKSPAQIFWDNRGFFSLVREGGEFHGESDVVERLQLRGAAQFNLCEF